MIHISQVIPMIERELKRLAIQDAIQFKTYKKDRGFLLYRLDETHYQLVENGFQNDTITGSLPHIQKQAHKALKREFPRSNMVWVSHYSSLASPFDLSQGHHGSLF